MACRLFSVKPLPEPMLSDYQLDSWEQISVTFESKLCHFHSRKCILKCRLPKWRPFCPGGDELTAGALVLGKIWCSTHKIRKKGEGNDQSTSLYPMPLNSRYSSLPIYCGQLSSNYSRKTTMACPRWRGMGVFHEFRVWPKSYLLSCRAGCNIVLYCTATYRQFIQMAKAHRYT